MNSKIGPKKYFFRFRCRSRLTFGNQRDHQRPKPKGISIDDAGGRGKAVIFDERLPTTPNWTHFGLGFDTIIEDTDIVQARQTVQRIVYDISSTFAFSESCYVGKPEFVLEYCLPDSGINLQEARAIMLDNHQQPEVSARGIDLERFEFIFGGINSIADPDLKLAVKNSLHWFWKALADDDLRDRFLHLWIAVEHLEAPLRKFYGSASRVIHYPKCRFCKSQADFCPSCKKDFGYKANAGFVGYKQLESEVGLRSGHFSQLHRVRSKLVHGGRSALNEPEILKFITDAHVMLSKAIFVLSGIDHSMTVGLRSDMLGPSLPLALFFQGDMSVTRPLSINDVDLQPFINGEFHTEFHLTADGEIEMWTDASHHFNGAFKDGQMNKVVGIDSTHQLSAVWEKN